jgi:hypothetical protein
MGYRTSFAWTLAGRCARCQRLAACCVLYLLQCSLNKLCAQSLLSKYAIKALCRQAPSSSAWWRAPTSSAVHMHADAMQSAWDSMNWPVRVSGVHSCRRTCGCIADCDRWWSRPPCNLRVRVSSMQALVQTRIGVRQMALAFTAMHAMGRHRHLDNRWAAGKGWKVEPACRARSHTPDYRIMCFMAAAVHHAPAYANMKADTYGRKLQKHHHP